MKHSSLSLAIGTSLLCGLLLASSNTSYAQNKFPDLEIIPYPKEKMTSIVAREVAIPGGVSFSAGYLFPGEVFSMPKFYSFTIYGYHDSPQWKAIKTVNFKFGSSTFSKKPLYHIEGPDRDKSMDAVDANYFESLIVEIPLDVARQIVDNKGVVVTTDPATFYSAIPASKLDRFRQVVDSVADLSKPIPPAAPQSVKIPRPILKKIAKQTSSNGLPISEVFTDATGATTLQTALTPISVNFSIQGMAFTEVEGRKVFPPLIALMLLNIGPNQIWSDLKSVTLSYGDKKLILSPNARNSKSPKDGVWVEALTLRVPYKNFQALVKAKSFYISVGDASFEIKTSKMAGLRELVRRANK